MSNLQSGIHSIGNSLISLAPQLLTQGTNGSRIGLYVKPKLIAKHVIMTDDDVADMGRPSCQKAMIAVVGNSGGDGTFIKCADVHIDFACMKDEETAILRNLYGGFFWE